MKTPTDDLIALICKSVAEEYGADRTVPGMVIAHIPADKSETGEARFYCSVRRYDADVQQFGPVVAKAYGADLDEAVRDLAEQVANPWTEHQRELAKAVGAK